MPKSTQTVADFIASLPAERQTTVTAIHKAILKAVPKLAPYVSFAMGTPVIGYGKYNYKSASGREGEWFTIGLAVGKGGYAIHICVGGEGGYLVEKNAKKLGKVKTGRSCINFKKLEDLELEVAMGLVKEGAKFGGINAVK